MLMGELSFEEVVKSEKSDLPEKEDDLINIITSDKNNEVHLKNISSSVSDISKIAQNIGNSHEEELKLTQSNNKLHTSINAILENLRNEYKSTESVKIFNLLKKLKTTVDNLIAVLSEENYNKRLKNDFDNTINEFKDFKTVSSIYEKLTENPLNKDNNKYINTFKYLSKEINNIKDNDLNNLIADFLNITDFAKYYVCLAMHLYANIYEIIKDLPTKFSDKNKNEKDIKIWNLFHVFLGSLSTNEFKGVHSNLVIPELLTNNRIYTSLKIFSSELNNNLENRLIFYKTKNLKKGSISRDDNQKYYFKVSTMFPDMNLQKCIFSVKNALNNIQEEKPFKDNVSNIIGYDKDNNLFINIAYDSQKKSIITFYPLFLNKNNDYDNDYDQVKTKLEKISGQYNNCNGTISLENYTSFYEKYKNQEKLSFEKLQKEIEIIREKGITPSPSIQEFTPDLLAQSSLEQNLATPKRTTKTTPSLPFTSSTNLSTPLSFKNKDDSISPSPYLLSRSKATTTIPEAVNKVATEVNQAKQDFEEKFKTIFGKNKDTQNTQSLPSQAAFAG